MVTAARINVLQLCQRVALRILVLFVAVLLLIVLDTPRMLQANATIPLICPPGYVLITDSKPCCVADGLPSVNPIPVVCCKDGHSRPVIIRQETQPGIPLSGCVVRVWKQEQVCRDCKYVNRGSPWSESQYFFDAHNRFEKNG